MIHRKIPRRFRLIFGAICLFVVGGAAYGDLPLRTEELVYSIIAFNGRDYSGTFVRSSSDTIYLIAGSDSFLSVRKTLVYFWPITASYRTDTDTLDYQFHGTLVVSGNGVNERLTERRYTYYNTHGKYEQNWRVAVGPDADRVYKEYQEETSELMKARVAYQNAESAYEQKLSDLADRLARIRRAGGDESSIAAEFKALDKPVAPSDSTEYIVPPAAIERAFIVNLKPGRYSLRFVNDDGTILEGSEKRLEVIRPLTAQNVGYDVIPGDKWTRPESSEIPQSALYVDGSTDLYLRPFYEVQFNDLAYARLVDNDARGNPASATWVKLQQVPAATIRESPLGGDSADFKEESFLVQQAQGASLGYKIVPWDASANGGNAKPDIIAYHVPLSATDRIIRLSTRDDAGAVLPGGQRQIRVIRKTETGFALWALVIAPLLAMSIVVSIRSRRYAR